MVQGRDRLASQFFLFCFCYLLFRYSFICLLRRFSKIFNNFRPPSYNLRLLKIVLSNMLHMYISIYLKLSHIYIRIYIYVYIFFQFTYLEDYQSIFPKIDSFHLINFTKRDLQRANWHRMCMVWKHLAGFKFTNVQYYVIICG